MKRSLKNETDMLGLITKIQDHLTLLDKKLDSLIDRSLPQVKPSPPVHNIPNNGRMMHKAICADCKKECTIPFKPSGDRPVYCQDCFSRRKVISLSKFGLNVKPKESAALPTAIHKEIDVQSPPAKGKKKALTAKKSIGKKKTVGKKK